MSVSVRMLTAKVATSNHRVVPAEVSVASTPAIAAPITAPTRFVMDRIAFALGIKSWGTKEGRSAE